MQKINFVWLAIVIGILCGCSTVQTAEPTVTPGASVTSSPRFISEQKAIELAGPNCRNPHLRPLQTSSNVRAQLMSVEKAEEYLGRHINCQCSDPTDMMLWIVEMDGVWQLLSGPEPTAATIGQSNTPIPTGTPAPSACYLIINAITGSPLGSGGKRK